MADGLDAILKKIFEKTPSLDGVLSKADQTKVPSLDAILISQMTEYTKTLEIDGYLQNPDEKTAALDAYLRMAGVKEPLIDAYIKAVLTKTPSLDADLNKQGIEKTPSLDAILYEVTGVEITAGIDAVIRKIDQAKTHSLDGYLKEGFTKISSLDAYLFGVILRSVSIDAALNRVGVEKTESIDALLHRIGMTEETSLDSLLLGLAANILSIDAILFSETGATKTLSVDGLLHRVGLTKWASIDSLLMRLALTCTASMDAFLYAAKTQTLGIDSYLSKGFSPGASLDAIAKRVGESRTTEFESLLLRTGVIETTLVDAFLSAAFSRTSSIDAYVFGALTRSVDLDSVLSGFGLTRTVVIDAIVTLSAEYQISAGIDSMLRRAGSSHGISLDAVIWVPGLLSAEPRERIIPATIPRRFLPATDHDRTQ